MDLWTLPTNANIKANLFLLYNTFFIAIIQNFETFSHLYIILITLFVFMNTIHE